MANFIICAGGPSHPLHKQNWALAHSLVGRGHQVAYVVEYNQRADVAGHNYGFPVLTWPAPSLAHWKEVAFFWQLLRRRRPAAVIANFFSVNIAMPLGLLCRVPVRIAWYRALTEQGRLDNGWSAWKWHLVLWGKRLANRCATHVAPVSAVTMEDACRVYGISPSKCRVFHTCRAEPSELWSENAENNTGKILCVGRLRPSKAQDVLIRAFKIITDTMPEDSISLEFLGEGPCLNEYQTLVRELELDGQVAFTGKVTPEEVYRKMARATVLALPYRADAGPGVVPEALGIGVPIVTTSFAAVVDVLGTSTAIEFVPVGNAEALAKTLRLVLTDAARRQRMSEDGRVLFRKKFHLDHWVTGVREWLEEITPAARPTPSINRVSAS
jgi:glycosyltransferase involved in cell wall biosynthesis